MVFPSLVRGNNQFFWHCQSQIDENSVFQIVLLKNLQQCLLWIDVRTTCGNCGTSITKKICLDILWAAVVEHCIVSNVSMSLLNKKMIQCIIVQKDTLIRDVQKHTSVNYITQNFPAFMLHVYTRTLNMEHNLDSERAILMWTQQEMLTTKFWETNWNLANTFWKILKWRIEDTESSTLRSHPSTCPWSTLNWISFSNNRNVVQQLTLLLDSFWKTLRKEYVDTFTLTRRILL